MKAVISLCDYTGVMVRPWAEAGFTCYCVDTAHSIRKDRVEGNIHFVWGDVRSWAPPEGVEPGILFAFPPCTHLATSGARDFRKKNWPLLRDGMDTFHACLQAALWARCPYAIENPVGRIAGIYAPAEHTFHPCDYGDPYTKLTCLWTGAGFILPEKKPVEPTQGSMISKLPENDERALLRSATPPGFARAVFEANRHLL